MNKPNRRGFLKLGGYAALGALMASCSTDTATRPPTPSRSRTAPATVSPMDSRLDASDIGLRLGLDYAALRSSTSQGVLVAGNARQDWVTNVAQIATDMPASVAGIVNETPKSTALIMLPSTAPEFTQWITSWGGEGIVDLAGITLFLPGELPWVALNPRLPGYNTPWDDSAGGWLLRHVVAHETFHAVTLPSGFHHVPLWLAEGYAEYAAGVVTTVMPPQTKRAPMNPALPTDAQMRNDRKSPNAYFYSWAFVDYLYSVKSAAAAALYQETVDGASNHIDALCQRHFGAGLQSLEASWKKQYRQQWAAIDWYA